MDVRPARMDDIPRLIKYITAFHAATPWSVIPLSAASLKHGLQALIGAPNQCVFVHEFGAIGGMLAPMKFSADVLAQEVFWWAEKDGLSLMRAFESWARDKDAKAICMASIRGEGTEARLAKLYERRGYRPAEHFFIKGL